MTPSEAARRFAHRRRLGTRFERYVDRAGEHHLWLGSRNRRRWSTRTHSGSARQGSTEAPGGGCRRRVRGDRGDVEAVRATLRAQLRHAAPADRDASRWSLDDLLAPYPSYLEDQGKELRTRARYAGAAKLWISPVLGHVPTRRVTADQIDRCFARMRKAATFNLSFNGFRKFTSSELLDAGFNISVVAQRQGHGPEVLAKHYSQARMSARRRAANHLGRIVHGLPPD